MIALAYIPDVGFLTRQLRYDEIQIGVLEKIKSHRDNQTHWRLRVKRRGAGHTWKRLRELPKTIQAEALLLGIQLN